MKKMVSFSVVLTVLVVGTTLGAVDYFSPLFGGYADHQPIADSPCGPSSVIKSATPVVFDGTLMVAYLCTNAGVELAGNQVVIWRRYFRPSSGSLSAPAPQPVYLVTPQGQPAAPPTPRMDCSAYPGFVSNATGNGCVPPDHPTAK